MPIAPQTEPSAGAAPSEPLALALAACRAILFAGKQARRHRGDYNLNDLCVAESLAATALYAEQATGPVPSPEAPR
jgi:hypothetical protein